MKRAVVTCGIGLSRALLLGGMRATAQGPARPAAVRQTAYIKASNTHAGDHFGNGGTLLGDSVALSGDGNTLAVGAPDESSKSSGVNGNQNDTSLSGSGAVYVFSRNGNNWVQQAYVKASNPRMSANFGHAVALSADGNTLAVSAYFEPSNAKGVNGNQNDTSIPQTGAVYVFTRAGGRWTQQAYLKASNTGKPGTGDNFAEGDQFGFSVAISDDGNTIAVGANAEDSNASGINGNEDNDSAETSGAVYLFARTGTTWSQQAYLKASNNLPAPPRGRGARVGAPGEPTSGPPPGPAVFFPMQFGYAVSLSADGNTLAVGAFDEGGASREINGSQAFGRGGSGAIYVFTRGGGTWTQQAYIKASNAEAQDSIGAALALSDDGNTLLAGAIDEDCLATGVNPPEANTTCANDAEKDTSAGAAYLFHRTGTTWAQEAFIKPSNTGNDDWFGSRLTISGDGNTLAIPAQLEDSDAKGIDGEQKNDRAMESGAVYLFRRVAGQWTQIAYVKGSNTDAFDEFGSSVALNRDGTILASGARGEDGGAKGVNGNQRDNSADEAGAVYIFTLAPGAAAGSR
jgi:hypothetical protein